MNNQAQTEQPSVLRVLNVETKEDSRGTPYNLVTVATIGDKYVDVPGVGRVVAKSNSRPMRFVAYPKNYLDQADPGSDLKKGQYTLGDIVTVNTTPYTLTGNDGVARDITTYSFVVLGDTTKEDWGIVVARTFKRRAGDRMQMVDPNTGEVLGTTTQETIQESTQIASDLEPEAENETEVEVESDFIA